MTVNSLLLTLLLTALTLPTHTAVSGPPTEKFTTFATQYNKKYHSFVESKYREEVFNTNIKTISRFNSNPNATISQGLTSYADLTPQEFLLLVLNPKISTTPEALKSYQGLLGGLASLLQNTLGDVTGLLGLSKSTATSNIGGLVGNLVGGLGGVLVGLSSSQKAVKALPQKSKAKWLPPAGCLSEVDWRKNQNVSPVKMQGICGNCYSFSATGALQSAFMIKHSIRNISFSNQQITDCCGSSGFGCNGCEGGWQWQAIQYVQKYGIVTEEEYPTTSSEKGKVRQCKKIVSPIRILDEKTPLKVLPQGNVTALYQAVNKHPVSVGVDASGMQFVLSSKVSEVFSNCSSNFEDANHAMLVVGYDSDGNWILKNSWSSLWGDQGYIKLKVGNTCGVSNFALYPNVV